MRIESSLQVRTYVWTDAWNVGSGNPLLLFAVICGPVRWDAVWRIRESRTHTIRNSTRHNTILFAATRDLCLSKSCVHSQPTQHECIAKKTLSIIKWRLITVLSYWRARYGYERKDESKSNLLESSAPVGELRERALFVEFKAALWWTSF